jgi:hypothetical protein
LYRVSEIGARMISVSAVPAIEEAVAARELRRRAARSPRPTWKASAA